MLNKLKKINNKGFTIIEVMIVLAIAGLIILVVLLAVPALQRNSRNTALKNDASQVAAGVSEFRSNNDGTNPTTITPTTVSGPAAGTTSPVTIKLQANTAVAAGVTPVAGAIGYAVGAACPGGTTTPRAFAVYYTIEVTGGTNATKCIDA